jgi:hypothetical protein
MSEPVADRCGHASCRCAPVWRIEFLAAPAVYAATLACREHVGELRTLLRPYAVVEWRGERSGGEPAPRATRSADSPASPVPGTTPGPDGAAETRSAGSDGAS